MLIYVARDFNYAWSIVMQKIRSKFVQVAFISAISEGFFIHENISAYGAVMRLRIVDCDIFWPLGPDPDCDFRISTSGSRLFKINRIRIEIFFFEWPDPDYHFKSINQLYGQIILAYSIIILIASCYTAGRDLNSRKCPTGLH